MAGVFGVGGSLSSGGREIGNGPLPNGCVSGIVIPALFLGRIWLQGSDNDDGNDDKGSCS